MATDAYSIGSNWTPTNPSYAIFQVLSSAPPAVFSGKSYFDTSLGVGVYANGIWNYGGGGGGGAITSVFSRTGVITAQSGDYTFAQIGAKPTTTSGYGITDALTTSTTAGGQLSGTYPNPTLLNSAVIGKVLTGYTTGTGYVVATDSILTAIGRLDGSINYGYYGVIYNKSSFANTSDFTTNGATATINGTGIDISGGTAFGDGTHSLDLTYPTCLDQWIIEATFTVGTVNSTSFGIGIGMRSSNSFFPAPVYGTIDLSSNVTAGKVQINAVGLGSATLSSGALVFVTGNTLYLRFERKGSIFTFTVYNQTTKTSTIELAYSMESLTSGGSNPPNTGNFSIFSSGGTQTMKSFKVSSNANINVDYAIVGDSKSIGFDSNSYTSSWAGQLSSYAKVINLSGSGDRIADVQARVNEIIALKPKNVLLTIGRNDVAINSGVVSPTIQTNYATLITALQTAGINVIIPQPFFEITTDLTAWNTYIVATYPTLLIDTWTPTLNLGAAGIADNVHPNQIGHDCIFTAIKTSGKIRGLYLNNNFATVNKAGQKGQVSFYNLNNELSFDSNLTYTPTTVGLKVGGLNIYNSSVQYTNIALNGTTTAANTNFLSGTADTNLYINRPSGKDIIVRENNATENMRIKTGGFIGIGQSSPTAFLHLKAGAATASNAPLKFATGTNLTSPEAGAMEFDGTNYFVTSSTTRYTVAKSLTNTATLDFSSTAAGTSSDLTITVTGAAVGDVVTLGADNASVVANSSFSAWVSATNTVTVRFNNYSSGAIDPASGSFRVAVLKY